MKWQPIETAPKDGTWIILYAPDEQNPEPDITYWVAKWNNEAWRWQNQDDVVLHDYEATHWMRIPEPPKPSGKMSRLYDTAELTGPNEIGLHGFILWAANGNMIATFRMEASNENLDRWMLEMVTGNLVDHLNDTPEAAE